MEQDCDDCVFVGAVLPVGSGAIVRRELGSMCREVGVAQQPIPKASRLVLFKTLMRDHKPVDRLRECATRLKGTDEVPAREFPLSEDVTIEYNTQSHAGGLDRHEGAVEAGAAQRAMLLHLLSCEPHLPAHRTLDRMNEGDPRCKLLGTSNRVALRKYGRRQRDRDLTAQWLDMKSPPVPVPESDLKIHIFPAEVGFFIGGIETNVDLWILRDEFRKSWQQPLRCKARGRSYV